MTKNNDHMTLWNSVCTTDPDITKPVKIGGRTFTEIDPQIQLKRATELWGPYGFRWGLRNLKWDTVGTIEYKAGKAQRPVTGPAEITLEAEFFYPTDDTTGGSFWISNEMQWLRGDEVRKKLFTNTRSKALSLLGFNSDVYEGKFDDSRYVEERRQSQGSTQPQAPPAPPPPPQPGAPAPPPPAAAPPPTTAPPAAEAGPYPAGWYMLVVEKAQYGMSKEANNPMYTARMKVTSPEHYDSCDFNDFFVFPHWSGEGEEPFPWHKTRRFCEAIGLNMRGDPNANVAAMPQRYLVAKLKQDQYTNRQGQEIQTMKIDGLNIHGPNHVPPEGWAGGASEDVDLTPDVEDEDFLPG